MQGTKKLEENKIKTREQNKGSKIKTLLSLPIHLAHHRSTVKALSLRCCTAIATLSLCCRSAVATLSHCYCSTVAPPLLLLCRDAVTTLSHRYCSTVASMLLHQLFLRSRTAIASLLLRCCCSCCRYAVAPLSHRCRAVVELRSLWPREDILN